MDDDLNELACPDCGEMVGVIFDWEPGFKKITCEHCGETRTAFSMIWVRTLGDLLR